MSVVSFGRLLPCMHAHHLPEADGVVESGLCPPATSRSSLEWIGGGVVIKNRQRQRLNECKRWSKLRFGDIHLHMW